MAGIVTPSGEQQEIINAVAQGSNVLVDAVAGSGKTTTVLSIARALPQKRIVQITFNALLKLEVRAKVNEAGLHNLSVYTYHSLATTFYDKTAYNDGKLLTVLEEDMHIVGKVPRVDIIMIDEAQDMTTLYFRLIRKFMCDIDQTVQLVVLGDRHQAVYAFMQADARFLTHAPDVWKRDFVRLTLRESYRLTKQIAWFVNNVMVNEDRIIARKHGVRVDYHLSNPFKQLFIEDIILRIRTGQLIPEDIFILTASLKSTAAPAKYIENAFVQAGIPVYVPLSDDAKLDDDVTRGKVVFTTFPSSKGRERKVVIVLGFDAGYFKFFARTEPSHICPSTLYVAATRAKERLILVGNAADDMPNFVRLGQPELKNNLNIYGSRKVILKGRDTTQLANMPSTFRKSSPTDIVRYLKQDTIQSLTPLVESLFVTLAPANKGVSIPSKVKSAGKNQFEDVSDLNGLAIPVMWEAKHCPNGITTIHKRIADHVSISDRMQNTLRSALATIKFPCVTCDHYLHLCNAYQAKMDGYHGRIAQIKKYSWLDIDLVNACHRHLDQWVKYDDLVFESNVGVEDIATNYGTLIMDGFIDAVNIDTVWEFKCVDALQLEHFLQLVVYAWLYKKKFINDKTFRIMNLRTGEVKQINYDENIVNKIMDLLIAHKFSCDKKLSDAEFLNKLDLFPIGSDHPHTLLDT